MLKQKEVCVPNLCRHIGHGYLVFIDNCQHSLLWLWKWKGSMCYWANKKILAFILPLYM